MRPKYLVTGAKGMLGSDVLKALGARRLPCVGTDLPEHDLTVEADARALFAQVSPTHVIHCAAYTNVDKAESETDLCMAVNVGATVNLVRACAESDARLLMVSTDFVFDGKAREPYPTNAKTNPLGAYARSKLEAERALAAGLDDHQIVRTAWLFGANGPNFVRAILSRLRRGQPLRVVRDQTGGPTYTVDLAGRLADLSRARDTGVFHVTNAGQCTWHEFARAIAEESGFDPDAIEAIPGSAWPSPAPRPEWSVLDCSQTWASGVEPMPEWRDALARFLAAEPDQGRP